MLQKSELESGGMLLIKPDGTLLQTEAILADIKQNYPQHFFWHLYQSSSVPVHTEDSPSIELPIDLNQKLYAAGWDYETV